MPPSDIRSPGTSGRPARPAVVALVGVAIIGFGVAFYLALHRPHPAEAGVVEDAAAARIRDAAR